MPTAKEIATKNAGRIVQCRLTKSAAIEDVPNGKEFEGKIVGWKAAIKGEPEYVAIEVSPPGKTNYLMAHFKGGYTFTTIINKAAYAKKVLPEEIMLPATVGKFIDQWPHKCIDCGSPAQFLMNAIDCSNEKCRHKYRTGDSTDLFMPKEMQTAIGKPKNMKPARKDVDADGFMICSTCNKRAISISNSSTTGHRKTSATVVCASKHKWKHMLQADDKILLGGIPHAFDGKMTFVPVKP